MQLIDFVLETLLPAERYILRGLNPQGIQRGSIRKNKTKNLAMNGSFVKGLHCCSKIVVKYPIITLRIAKKEV